MPADHARPIRVFLVDDHEVVRRGIRCLVETADDLVVVGEVGTVAEAGEVVAAARPHVAVLDVRLGDGSGIDLCRAIRSEHPEVRCLMLTSFTDPEALAACALAGASGYVLKRIRGSDLLEDIRDVAAGRTLLGPTSAAPDPLLGRLTPQERRVLDLLTEGLTNRQIGERMGLTEKTVKNYVSNLLAKLEMGGRTQAAVYGARAVAQASTGSTARPSRSRWALRNE